MTCPSDNELAELVDGSIAAARRAILERHLDDCDTCARLVAELAWVVGGTSAPPGYRFVRELAPNVFDAVGPDQQLAIVELGAVDPKLAAVRHPGVATIFEVGDGFVAYERVVTPIRSWAVERSPSQRLAAWTQAIRGLAAIHQAGAVHGRITPEHVFVDRDRVVIGGFAQPVSRTAGYLAAEVLEGKPPSAESDQLAACVALYEALAGKKPFAGATPGALAVAMATPPPLPPGLDRRRAVAIVRGLAFKPADRWPDLGALVAALEEPGTDKRPWVIAAIAVAAIAIALIAI